MKCWIIMSARERSRFSRTSSGRVGRGRERNTTRAQEQTQSNLFTPGSASTRIRSKGNPRDSIAHVQPIIYVFSLVGGGIYACFSLITRRGYATRLYRHSHSRIEWTVDDRPARLSRQSKTRWKYHRRFIITASLRLIALRV